MPLQLELIFEVSKYAHIGFGLIALVLFWIPISAKKGSYAHRKSGSLYRSCMWILVWSGVAMMALHGLNPFLGLSEAANAERVAASRRMFVPFFTLLLAIVAFNLVHGQRALAKRNHKASVRHPVNLALLVIMGLAAAINLYLGSSIKHPLLIGFGALGLYGFYDSLRKVTWRYNDTDWLHEHIASFIGTGIGAYTGFFVFGAQHLIELRFSGYFALIPWITPTIVGLILTQKWIKRTRKTSVRNTI